MRVLTAPSSSTTPDVTPTISGTMNEDDIPLPQPATKDDPAELVKSLYNKINILTEKNSKLEQLVTVKDKKISILESRLRQQSR